MGNKPSQDISAIFTECKVAARCPDNLILSTSSVSCYRALDYELTLKGRQWE